MIKGPAIRKLVWGVGGGGGGGGVGGRGAKYKKIHSRKGKLNLKKYPYRHAR